VLGSYILHERLGVLGRVGCATCLIGSVVIVLHAPPDKELHDIDELLHYALSLGAYTRGGDELQRCCLRAIQRIVAKY